MSEKDLSHLAEVEVVEGEEHVTDSLAPELGGRVPRQGQDTDLRVPGRLLGRDQEYEKIGAEPYIVRSEFI
jgi:hypothetical protein